VDTKTEAIQRSRPIINRLKARRALALWWWRTNRRSISKRAIDLAAVTLGMVIAAPILLIVAFFIKAHDRGPVLFWQRRVGKDGKEFDFPKFRSMVVNAEQVRAAIESANHHGGDAVTFKIKRDPRVTPIGRVIRRTSIDELPQLWCVLKGDMSLVGPRPALVSEVDRYTLKDRERLSVTPGLTCIWQVSGRSDIPFPEQVEMDLEYIRGHSLWSDIKLLLATLPAIIGGRGAY
jgi:lipopolysaccharide/colanic/teichoic acid biosynthesis glycosyltransferase